jgi:ribosome maturation factor RimP
VALRPPFFSAAIAFSASTFLLVLGPVHPPNLIESPVSRAPLQQRLISIVEPVCEAAGYELVDLRFVLEQGGWTLRVAVDLPLDGQTDVDEVPMDRVDLEDCENLSRELSAVLDVEDPIPQAFSLEVSSPGIDRPLRTTKHYRHFIGSEAKIQLAAPLVIGSGSAGSGAPERRNFKGILRGVEDQPVPTVVIECDGTAFRLPIDDIEHAKLVPDWDAVMKGKSGVGKPATKPVKPGHRPSRKAARGAGTAGASDQAQHHSSRHASQTPGVEPGNDAVNSSGKSPNGSRAAYREAVHDREAGGVTEGDWRSENPSGKSPNGSRAAYREAVHDREAGGVTEGDWRSENKEQG